MVFQTITGLLDNYFEGVEFKKAKNKNYCLRVAVAGPRVTPRDERFEYFRDVGVKYLEPILHQTPIDESYLRLVFPERWLSVHEQHYLLYSLEHHPDTKSGKITNVDVLTQNPLIASSGSDGLIVVVNISNSRGLTEYELQKIINGKYSAEEIYQLGGLD